MLLCYYINNLVCLWSDHNQFGLKKIKSFEIKNAKKSIMHDKSKIVTL